MEPVPGGSPRRITGNGTHESPCPPCQAAASRLPRPAPHGGTRAFAPSCAGACHPFRCPLQPPLPPPDPPRPPREPCGACRPSAASLDSGARAAPFFCIFCMYMCGTRSCTNSLLKCGGHWSANSCWLVTCNWDATVASQRLRIALRLQGHCQSQRHWMLCPLQRMPAHAAALE